MVDTVRTVDELINSIFASGQLPKSINEQDVRDALVSISLETTDLSSLPRSPAGLAVGRLWIDQNKALRVVTVFQPVNQLTFVSLDGRGRLFAQGLKPGAQTWLGSATFSGTGGVVGSPGVLGSPFAAAPLSAAGVLLAAPTRRILGVGKPSGSAAITGAAVQRMRGSRTLGGAGSFVGTGTVGGGGLMTWAAGPNVTRADGNLTFINGFAEFDVSWVATTGTVFKTSGKWYVEIQSPPRNQQMAYGIANPSFNNADGLGGDENSWGLYDNWDGTGYDLYNGSTTYFSEVVPPQEDSVVSLAIDCTNWKWWCRIDGGAWSSLGGGTQNPATNQGGMSIPTNLRTGGVSVAAAMDGGQDIIHLYPSAATWVYTPPSGFGAM